MPLSTQSQSGNEEYILVASLDNARNLSNILKAISFKDHAIFNATQNGLKVTVEDSKCLQANAFIQADIFQEFTLKEDIVGFQVNLTVLLDCLTIFGGSTVPGVNTALRMCYNGYGYPLTLFLEEGGVVTVCKINTQEPEELIDFDFCSTNVTNKVILQSDSLKEAFSELDMTSEILQLTMSPSHPYFRLSTFGNSGNAHYDYPKDSDMMELFQCRKTQTNRYKMSLLKPSTKALALSCKVSVRTDGRAWHVVRREASQRECRLPHRWSSRRCSAQDPVTSALRPAEGSNVAHPFNYGQSKFSDLASGGQQRSPGELKRSLLRRVETAAQRGQTPEETYILEETFDKQVSTNSWICNRLEVTEAPTESCSVSWKPLRDGKPHMHKHDIPPHCVKDTAMKTSHCYPVWGGHSSPAQSTGMCELIPDNDDEVMPEDP
ncbi:hypothetical protein AOLI_G00293700 [Acnodon oligacanthus]